MEQVFHEKGDIVIYDPPKNMGSKSDLIDTDFVFICVPTQRLPNGECDVSIVEEVVQLASPRQAIVCHSTVAIGTTERLIQSLTKPLVFVPEYAGESTDHPYRSLGQRDFFIFGGHKPAVLSVQGLFKSVYGDQAEYLVTSPTTAEVVKYMENSFLALKVGFCNEFYDLCNAVNVDYDSAKEMWLRDSRINRSHTTVTEERGYGGSCLPKDVSAVCSTGREVGSPMALLEALQEANAIHRGSVRRPTEVVI